MEEQQKNNRIAFVINSLKSRNGASVFLVNLLLSLSNQGFSDFILISLYDEIDDSLMALIKQNNIEIIFCHKRKRIDFAASKLFKNILLSFRPAIINIHLSVLPTYFLAFLFNLKKKKWHIVKTYHSIPGKDLDKVSLILEKYYANKGAISFIGISESITNLSRDMYPSSRVVTISNGIPTPPINHYDYKKEYDFIIVASLEPVKNHELLFDAFELFLKKHNHSRLLVVGDGSLMEKYKKRILLANLQNNVVFTGAVDNVYYWLSKSMIFVLSSIREGNPISILEAVSMHMPIIAPNIGGIPDVIVSGINGLLFEPNDLKGLLDAMTKMKDIEQLRLEIIKNNKELSKEISIATTAKKYLDYFDSIKRDN